MCVILCITEFGQASSEHLSLFMGIIKSYQQFLPHTKMIRSITETVSLSLFHKSTGTIKTTKIYIIQKY